MANLAPVLKQQFFDSNGDPLVGGKLYTYAAGTTTPKVTYKDRDASQANTNPIILDARGECDVWISGVYKFVLKDANDATFWSVDKVTGQPQAIESVANLTERDALSDSVRYEGMLIYVVSENKTYQLQGGITNSNWVVFYSMSPSVETFSGTGAQVDFSLTSSPGTTLNTEVFIDGVRQTPTTNYTVTGTILTFTTAPYSGAGILVVYGMVNSVNVPSNSSVTTTKIVDGAVTNAKIATGAISNDKLGALGQQISASSGNFQTSSLTDVSIPNLSVSITTTGRPVYIGLKTDNVTGTGGLLGIGAASSTNVTATISIRRGGTAISIQSIINRIPSAGSMANYYPIGSLNTIDPIAAGTYTYDIVVKCSGTSPVFEIESAKLVVFEL